MDDKSGESTEKDDMTGIIGRVNQRLGWDWQTEAGSCFQGQGEGSFTHNDDDVSGW